MKTAFDFLIILIYLIIPILLFIQLWRDRSQSLFRWLLKAIICGVYAIYLFLIGVWSITPIAFMRYPILFAFFIVFFKSAKNIKRSIAFSPVRFKSAFSYTINLVLCLVFTWASFEALRGSVCPENVVHLEFPLRGQGKFAVIHGGANESINHHYPVGAQRFALDIVQVDQLGRRAKFNAKKVDDFHIYGSIISSPCDGVVVQALDIFEDLKPSQMDPGNPGGNFLAIEVKGSDDVVVVLAHLKKGSLLVQKGDVVKKGEPIARVGNTGNTSEPHLHIHCVKGSDGDFLFSGKGLPMKFNDRFLVRNDRF